MLPEKKSFVKQLWEDLFKPHIHLGSFLLRLGLAVIFIYHGILKLALEGGRHWDNTIPPLPEDTQMAVAWGETLCGFALLAGLFSRLASIGLIVIMVGAIVLQTGRHGLILIEFSKTPSRTPTGAEYNVMIIVMCLAILAIGSGKVSLDYFLFGRGKETPPVGP